MLFKQITKENDNKGKREPVEESVELRGDAFVDFYKENGSQWRNQQS